MKQIDELLINFATPTSYVTREVHIGATTACVAYNPDFVDTVILTELIKSLENADEEKGIDSVLSRAVCIAESKIESDMDKAREAMLDGDVVVAVGSATEYIVCNLRKWDKRAISEPPTSTVMRGPREGFIEDMKSNLTLIERRLKSRDLAIEKLTIGRQSRTAVAVVYMKNIADRELIRAVRDKLKNVDVDTLMDSHYLQPVLEERPFSIFHQTGVSEKPDIVAAKLLEGRVAIVVDGSPMVITVPFMMIEDYQAAEDYYERASLSTFLRVLRIAAIFFSILLPGLYVAVQQFHYSIIPLRFLLTVMTAVDGIPLSPITEILFVILLFEIIREASVRMPRAVGMAMSIVGALVLGDTAVKAGIISSPAVMITALSSIALYTAPNQEGTFTILRVAFTLLGGLGGMYFLLLGTLYLILYLCSLSGFGVPYMAPLAPLIPADLKDSFYRVSLLRMYDRPKSIKTQNPRRRK